MLLCMCIGHFRYQKKNFLIPPMRNCQKKKNIKKNTNVFLFHFTIFFFTGIIYFFINSWIYIVFYILSLSLYNISVRLYVTELFLNGWTDFDEIICL